MQVTAEMLRQRLACSEVLPRVIVRSIMVDSWGEPHTSVTALHMRVYLCLLAWTDHLP